MKGVPQEKIGYGAKTSSGVGSKADKQAAGARGFVIAIDGPDGAGKTTQVKLLADYLRQAGKTVHTTRSSGGTAIGEALRAVSLSKTPRPPETDLYISLAMAADIAEDIAEKKEQGQTIIIDRSPLTYIAYNAFGSQLKDEQLAYDACEAVCDSWLIDKLVLLNAPQRLLDSRRQKRQTSDYFEAKDEAYHSRVRRGYEAGRLFLSQHPKIGRRVVQIDASGTIEEIHQQVLAAIEL